MPTNTPNLGIQKPLGNEAFSLEAINDNYDIIDAAATKTATANKLIQRDASGRGKVAAPAVADDIARKDTVEGAITHGMMRQGGVNCNFDVWQRGGSFLNPPSGEYTADRWKTSFITAGATFPATTHARLALSGGEVDKSIYAYRLIFGGGVTGLATGSSGLLEQPIENGVWKLSGAGKKITVSFWARSSLPGKRIGIYLAENYGTGGTPASPTIDNGTSLTLTSAFTKYTFTFSVTSLSGKVFGTNNDDFLSINLMYIWGSTYNSRFNTASTETVSAAGTIDIAQIQVNSGDVALPFQPRSFAEELTLCQRYYENSKSYGDAPTDVSYRGAAVPYILGQPLKAWVQYRVPKRTNVPTASANNVGRTGANSVLVGGSNLTTVLTSKQTGFLLSSPGTAGTSGTTFAEFDWEVDAEL